MMSRLSSSPCSAIGVIGLGLMGGALVRRLAGQGIHVTGFDISPAAASALESLVNFRTAVSPGEILSEQTLILLSLPTHREVQAILTDDSISLAPGTIIVDTTTGNPASSAALAAELQARGVHYLDATISGHSQQLERGDVIWMVGGDSTDFEQVKWLFDVLGRECFHVGPAGSGAVMKLITNLVLGLNRAALAEGLAFAERCHLDLEQVASILKASAAYSRIMDSKADKMIQRDYTPQARLTQHLKDVRLIRQLAAGQGMVPPLSTTHQQILTEAENQGWGGMDNCALYEVLRMRPVDHE